MAGSRAVGAYRLLDLPPELLQLVARCAYEHDVGFAFASRATLDATAQPLGIDSFFAVCAQAVLARIERHSCPQERLGRRVRLVQRAIEAGNDAELFIWPIEAIAGPRPSPLREHPWDNDFFLTPKGTQHSVPMEHNFQVGLGHPDPTGECKRRHSIDSVHLWTRDGYLARDPLDEVCSVGMRLGNDQIVQAYGKNAHVDQLYKTNHTRTAPHWVPKASLRRMAIRLLPNSF